MERRLSPTAYTLPACNGCNVPATTRRRIANRSSPSAVSCVRAMTPCWLPASVATANPRPSGWESLRFPLRVRTTWRQWHAASDGGVAAVTGALHRGARADGRRRGSGSGAGGWLDQERDDQQRHDVRDLDH